MMVCESMDQFKMQNAKCKMQTKPARDEGVKAAAPSPLPSVTHMPFAFCISTFALRRPVVASCRLPTGY
jgi:hypothetical protein